MIWKRTRTCDIIARKQAAAGVDTSRGVQKPIAPGVVKVSRIDTQRRTIYGGDFVAAGYRCVSI